MAVLHLQRWYHITLMHVSTCSHTQKNLMWYPSFYFHACFFFPAPQVQGTQSPTLRLAKRWLGQAREGSGFRRAPSSPTSENNQKLKDVDQSFIIPTRNCWRYRARAPTSVPGTSTKQGCPARLRAETLSRTTDHSTGFGTDQGGTDGKLCLPPLHSMCGMGRA